MNSDSAEKRQKWKQIIRKGRGNRKCRPSFREEAIPDSSLSESESMGETNGRRK